MSISGRFENLIRHAMKDLPSRVGDKLHYSYIIRRNDIICFGINRPRTHTLAAYHNYSYPTIHSELDCFNRRPRNLDFSRCTFVNIRLSISSINKKVPILRMSRPCKYCSPWLISCGFRDIIYSTDDGFRSIDEKYSFPSLSF